MNILFNNEHDQISIAQIRSGKVLDHIMILHGDCGIQKVYVLASKDRMNLIEELIKNNPKGHTIEEVKELKGILTIGGRDYIDITLLAFAHKELHAE